MKNIIKQFVLKDKDKIKDTLEKEKKTIEREIKQLEANNEDDNQKTELQEAEYESNVGDLIIKENNNSIKESLSAYLKQVKIALNRMKNKKYGICENCGKEISIERLKVNPSAIYCLKCAEKLEENETA